jgi:hypothetical protein
MFLALDLSNLLELEHEFVTKVEDYVKGNNFY